MFEIYSLFQKNEETQPAHPANSYTPKAWDYVTLRLGNWLINLGCNLKSRSIFSQFSKKRA